METIEQQWQVEVPSASVQNFTRNIHHDTYPAINSRKANMSGKSILVTGASSGCGKAMTLSFARAGASRLAILARRDMLSLITEIKAVALASGHSEPRVLMLRADQTDQGQVEAAAEKVDLEFGSLDILINNAGYMETWKRMADTDPREWWRAWEVNVKGPYLVTRSFLPLLLRSATKTVIQVTSMGALCTGTGASAYQGTKAALLRMSSHLRIEYGAQGLLIHSLHPGAVKTELALTMPDHVHNILKDTPELCGDVAVWLTLERREWLQDRFVSSQWDMEELEARKEEINQRDLLRLRLIV